MLSVKKTIVFGITGGIAAFKAKELILKLRKEGYDIHVIMTKNATKMIPPKEFETVSGSKVYTELFENNFDYKAILKKREVDHIQLADMADLFVIIPATANTIAKIAHGIADDFLTTTLLATKAPILLCPSMNVNMWMNPLVQRNISKAKEYGFSFIDPDSGILACGYEGKGRLADLKSIEKEIHDQFSKTEALQGKNIIVTAGGTIEKIDNIRFITNRSSGKMGVAFAEACYQRGANVLLLRAKSSVHPRFSMKEKTFETADDLQKLLEKYAQSYNFCFHSAAVSDFFLATKYIGKISSKRSISLELIPRVKLLEVMKKVNPLLRIIAFKAEWGLSEKELTAIAFEKIKQFKLEALIINDVSKKNQGFEVDSNEARVILKNGRKNTFPLTTKRSLASQIIDYLIINRIC